MRVKHILNVQVNAEWCRHYNSTTAKTETAETAGLPAVTAKTLSIWRTAATAGC
jgi:glycerate kinase